MVLVRGLGIRGCSVLLLAHVIACSDDGVPATSDDPSDGGTTGTATMSGTDATMTGTTAESSITDPTGVTVTTTDATSGTATSPTDTSSADTSATGTDSTTGEPGNECMQASDCEVVDDCCSCTAIPIGAEPPACDLESCLQSTCSAEGIHPIAHCELGNCEVLDASCDPSLVTCEAKPPVCDPGTLPGVNPVTACWTGDCVPNDFCDVVPAGCDACGEDEVCVQNVAQMVTSMCVPIPRDCNGTPTCECMGEVCQEPFGTCNDDGEGIDCICIAC